MKLLISRVKDFVRARVQFFECLLIFCSCLFIYWANGQLIGSSDSIPHSLIALHWLENGMLNFDAFRQGHYYMSVDAFGPNGIPYFFAEAPNGHLTSAYPIGVSIVTFPLYLIFFVYLKIVSVIQAAGPDVSSNILDVTAQGFEIYRRACEKIAAVITTSLAVVLFYLSVKLKFNRAVAIAATFIYAFATSNWTTSSQALWQHTISNLALVSILLCLLKANRTSGLRRKVLLVTAGFFCGLLPGIRPTSLLFSIAVFIYSVFEYRRDVIFLLLGCSSFLFNAFWNFYYFGISLKGLVVGGYSSLFNNRSSSYQFSLAYFIDAFFGLLVSPSRGLLIYSPVILFAIPGANQAIRDKVGKDEKLLVCLLIACGVLFIQYCFYIPWWGAITYGSRFLVDTLPVLCFLVSYFIANQFDSFSKGKRHFTSIFTAFLLSIIFSTSVQVIGTFSDRSVWDTSPIPHHSRFWDWKDSQISRHAISLYFKLVNPIDKPQAYRRNLKGVIETIGDMNYQPINSPLVVTPSQEMVLTAVLKNTGKSQWFGYETGMRRGGTKVRVRFMDSSGHEAKVFRPSALHISGMPEQGETATAIGNVTFPEQPGNYQATFSLISQDIGRFPRHPNQWSPELEVNVMPKNS
jgi:hypothetical protein